MTYQKTISVINKAIADQDIYGASYSLIGQDTNLYAYHGFQGKGDQHQPLTPNLLYDLASVSKVVGTTTRIFQLLSQEKISLKDTIGDYISDSASPEIKIENLLMHTSGFQPDFDNVHQMTKDELIDKVKAAKPQRNDQQAQYSDLNYIYLGWIIEKIDKLPLDKTLAKHIFEPLKMTRTMYNPPKTQVCVPTEYQADRGGIICGQVHDYKAYLLDGISGHAGLFSTLSDLTQFLRVLLNGGEFEGKQIFPEIFYDYLKDHRFRQNDRTLGWQLWASNKNMFWHTGFTGTSIAFDLDKKTGFICLTNRIYPTRENRKWIKDRRTAIAEFFNEQEKVSK